MTTILELSDSESALIVSTRHIQVCLPDSIMARIEKEGGGDVFLLPDSPEVFPSKLVVLLQILLGDDKEFTQYVYNRVLEIQNEGVDMQEIDGVAESVDEEE